jgi:hypothetical protein
MNYLSVFLLIVTLFGAGSIILSTLRYGISPMPTDHKAKKALLELCHAPSKGMIYELGAGWGTLAIPLAKKFPNCTVHAFEASFVPWLCCYLRSCFSRTPNLQVHRSDFFSESLEKADLVVLYLYPGAMTRLAGKLDVELKEGGIVVSNTFALPGWAAEGVVQLDDIYQTHLYRYLVK